MAAFTRPDPDDRAAFDAHIAKVPADDSCVRQAVTRDGMLVGSGGSYVMDGDTEVPYWIDTAWPLTASP